MQEEEDVLEHLGWRCSEEKRAVGDGCQAPEFRERSGVEIEIQELSADKWDVVMGIIPIKFYEMIPSTPKVHCRQHCISDITESYKRVSFSQKQVEIQKQVY